MRRRRPVDPLGPQQPWAIRRITLIADRSDTARICEGWAEAGWDVLTVDEGVPSPTGHPTHVVRVAVPPVGWFRVPELAALQGEYDA